MYNIHIYESMMTSSKWLLLLVEAISFFFNSSTEWKEWTRHEELHAPENHK